MTIFRSVNAASSSQIISDAPGISQWHPTCDEKISNGRFHQYGTRLLAKRPRRNDWQYGCGTTIVNAQDSNWNQMDE
jgi:hypothetical protein